MSTLMTLLAAAALSNAGTQDFRPMPAGSFFSQEPSSPAVERQERVVIHKDGGPGHGPDQPFAVREAGAKDLEGFVGGKYIIVEGPWDFMAFLLIVVLVVVIIILI